MSKNQLKNQVKIETTYPPLPPVLQKQVDDYLEKEKKMKHMLAEHWQVFGSE